VRQTLTLNPALKRTRGIRGVVSAVLVFYDLPLRDVNWMDCVLEGSEYNALSYWYDDDVRGPGP
jgi:hypothetical protein